MILLNTELLENKSGSCVFISLFTFSSIHHNVYTTCTQLYYEKVSVLEFQTQGFVK